MSALMVNATINFNDLKDLLQITDGNLASHIKGLEESGYLKVQKGFIMLPHMEAWFTRLMLTEMWAPTTMYKQQTCWWEFLIK